jgi:hypothetical protein
MFQLCSHYNFLQLLSPIATGTDMFLPRESCRFTCHPHECLATPILSKKSLQIVLGNVACHGPWECHDKRIEGQENRTRLKGLKRLHVDLIADLRIVFREVDDQVTREFPSLTSRVALHSKDGRFAASPIHSAR